jgi:hypothetical protein
MARAASNMYNHWAVDYTLNWSLTGNTINPKLPKIIYNLTQTLNRGFPILCTVTPCKFSSRFSHHSSKSTRSLHLQTQYSLHHNQSKFNRIRVRPQLPRAIKQNRKRPRHNSQKYQLFAVFINKCCYSLANISLHRTRTLGR